MRKRRVLLLGATLLVLVLASMAASVAGPTLAGSSKAADGNITCGNNGKLGEFNNISLHANTASDRTEVEGCSDGGAPNQQGRAVVRVNHNTAQPGVRGSLDSDRDQTPANICCSYINAQAGAEGTGLWCGTSGVPGDGYSRAWNSPGTEGGLGPQAADCIPGQ